MVGEGFTGKFPFSEKGAGKNNLIDKMAIKGGWKNRKK